MGLLKKSGADDRTGFGRPAPSSGGYATGAKAPNAATLSRSYSMLNCTEVNGGYPKGSTLYTKVGGRDRNSGYCDDRGAALGATPQDYRSRFGS